jgi:FtsH-binding integral membrane protein
MNDSSLYTYQNPELIAETQRNFIRKVFGWMFLGLLVTAAASFFMLANPALMQAMLASRWAWLILLIAEFGLVIFLTAAIRKLTPATAALSFLAYAVLNGVTLSVIFLIYTSASITQTFLICASMFGIMSLFGFTTKRDLTSLGSLLFMGLIGVVLAGLLNLFLRSSVIYWGVTIVGILVFIGLIAYDTQKLKKMSLSIGAEGQMESKASIIGALMLYLDFINLFLLLLRIFGRQK